MGIKQGAPKFVRHRLPWKLGSSEAHLACTYQFDKMFSSKEILLLTYLNIAQALGFTGKPTVLTSTFVLSILGGMTIMMFQHQGPEMNQTANHMTIKG